MHVQSQKKTPMGIEDSIFNRLTLLLGTETMDVVARQRVIIFGVGGVGSWCAESLVRSGIRHLTLVDSDCVCITNINRQLQATTRTVGKVKVEVLKGSWTSTRKRKSMLFKRFIAPKMRHLSNLTLTTISSMPSTV